MTNQPSSSRDIRVVLFTASATLGLLCILVITHQLQNKGNANRNLLEDDDVSAFNPKDYESGSIVPDSPINAESVNKYLDRLDNDLKDLENRVANLKDSPGQEQVHAA